jgi:hypothetical protein
MGAVWVAVYLAAVCAISGAATGLWLPRAQADPPRRGWFPGGEEEPEPQPQPEKHHRPAPSWARP